MSKGKKVCWTYTKKSIRSKDKKLYDNKSKEQATGIVREKAEELCKLVPGLANEVNFDRGKSKSSKEEFSFLFKNGSILDVMAARQSSRGRRATGGLIEEVILVDGTLLNEVIIPRFWGAAAWVADENGVNLRKKGVPKGANGEESRTPC